MTVPARQKQPLSEEEFRRHFDEVQRTAPVASQYLQDKFASEDGTAPRNSSVQRLRVEPRRPLSLILEAFRARRMRRKQAR